MDFKSSCLCKVRDTANEYNEFLVLLAGILKEVDFNSNLTPDKHKILIDSPFAKTEKEFEALKQPALLLKNSFNSFARKISIEYNYAVLGGEYYFNHVDDGIIQIDLAIAAVTNRYTEISELVSEVFREEMKILKQIIDGINLFKILFQRLAHFVKAVLEFRNDSIFIIAWHEDFLPDDFTNPLMSETQAPKNEYNFFLKYLELFKINLKVAYIDDNIRCSDKQIYDLYKIKRWLEIDADKLYIPHKILADKCEFLIKKVAIGLGRQSKPIFDDTQFLINGTKKIQPTDFVIDEYREFDQRLQKYYSSKTIGSAKLQYNDEVIEIERNIIASNGTNELTYSIVHHLSKVYLQNLFEIPNVIERFERLIIVFDESFKEQHSSNKAELFDKQAYLTTKIFLNNRKLEILVELAKQRIEKTEKIKLGYVINEQVGVIENYLSVIKSDQVIGIKNYFAFETICKFYAFIFEFLERNSAVGVIDFEQISQIIKNFSENYSIAYKNLKWCDERDYLQLYLPYTECLSEIKKDNDSEESIYGFLDSSYLIPVDYENCWRKLNELKDKFVESRIILINNLLTSKTEGVSENFRKTEELQDNAQLIASNIQALKSKVDPLLSQSIQTLGIFSGIIAFAFGSINAIPRFQCGEGIVLFLISLGAILIGFVWVINYLVIDKVESDTKFWTKRSTSGICILLVLLLCACFSLNLNDCGLNNENNNDGLHNSINFQPNNSLNQSSNAIPGSNLELKASSKKNNSNIKLNASKANPCCDSILKVKIVQ